MSSYVATIKPDSHVASWFCRGSHEPAATPHFFSALVRLCCVAVGCVSRSVTVHLNICSKLVINTTFLQNNSAGFAWFLNLDPICWSVTPQGHNSHRQFRDNKYLSPPTPPPITLRSLGMEFFWTLYMRPTKNWQTRRIMISILQYIRRPQTIYGQSYVYWTVHHCVGWRIRDQLDVTIY